MINYLKAGTKRVFGLHRPGREMRILPDDTFLVSYPKSGNTWMRLLISNLLSPDKPADLRSVPLLVPEMEAVTKKHLANMRKPRVIKSHFPFDPRYPRVIYMVRDPRDVVISQYHYQRKVGLVSEECTMAEYMTRFLAGQACRDNGSWGENVASWLIARDGDPRFLLVRYENLLSDGVYEMSRVADFLGISASMERLTQVVALGSADRMRQLESTQGKAVSVMHGRKDIPFVRAAKSGSWRSELEEALVRKIEAAWGPIMQYLGYELRFSGHSDRADITGMLLRKGAGAEARQ